MRWVGFVGSVTALLLAVSLALPATGQDRTEERLSTLETVVAEIDGRVAALEGNGAIPATPIVASPSISVVGFDVSLSGVGSLVTQDFHLFEGLYEVTVHIPQGCCVIVNLWADGESTRLFNEFFPDEGGSASRIVPVAGAVTVFLEVWNTDGPWTVTFAPR